MPSRRSPSCFGALLLPFMGLLIVGCFILAAVLWSVDDYARQRFGPPSPRLSAWQRYSLSIQLTLQSAALTKPVDPDGVELPFPVSPGESVASVAGRLYSAGLIADPQAFLNYTVYTGLDTTLQVGEYLLNPAMSTIEIALAMQRYTPTEATLTILPGWRMEEIAASLPTSGLSIAPQAFLRAVSQPTKVYSSTEALTVDTLEGFLFPGSYTLPRQTILEELIPIVLGNFETQVNYEMRSGYTAQGLSLYQAVTLASITQREAVVADEMPLIASVFYNRLTSGGRLASDPTVQYAVGFNQTQNTWWTNPLSAADLEIDSPYNTYLYSGLPPGPISNPGLAALQAVAFPAQTPYYYFRAACDNSGRHTFAETYEQHLANACP